MCDTIYSVRSTLTTLAGRQYLHIIICQAHPDIIGSRIPSIQCRGKADASAKFRVREKLRRLGKA